MSWYQEAQKNDSSKIKELLKAYKEEQDKTQKQALKEAIILVLGIKDTEDEPENPFMVDEVTEEKKDENKKNKSFSFPTSEEDIAKVNDLETLERIFHESKERCNEMEKTRLKHETFKQKKELDRKIWAVRRLGFIAHRKAFDIRVYNKKKENSTKINMMHKKRQMFINFIKQGYSFSRICEIDDGLKKEELNEIVNGDVLEACKPYMKNICSKWAKWCEMNLKEDK